METNFNPTFQGRLIIVRAVVGIAVIYLTSISEYLFAAIGLILCIWLDVGIATLAKSKQWQKSGGDLQLEGFTDFICFILAPALFTLGFTSGVIVWLCLAVFIVSGMWRIARFNTEGLKSGYYEGLPVTYNGYLFPIAAIIIYYLNLSSDLFYSLFLLFISALMVSRKFKVREF